MILLIHIYWNNRITHCSAGKSIGSNITSNVCIIKIRFTIQEITRRRVRTSAEHNGNAIVEDVYLIPTAEMSGARQSKKSIGMPWPKQAQLITMHT